MFGLSNKELLLYGGVAAVGLYLLSNHSKKAYWGGFSRSLYDNSGYGNYEAFQGKAMRDQGVTPGTAQPFNCMGCVPTADKQGYDCISCSPGAQVSAPIVGGGEEEHQHGGGGGGHKHGGGGGEGPGGGGGGHQHGGGGGPGGGGGHQHGGGGPGGGGGGPGGGGRHGGGGGPGGGGGGQWGPGGGGGMGPGGGGGRHGGGGMMPGGGGGGPGGGMGPGGGGGGMPPWMQGGGGGGPMGFGTCPSCPDFDGGWGDYDLAWATSNDKKKSQTYTPDKSTHYPSDSDISNMIKKNKIGNPKKDIYDVNYVPKSRDQGQVYIDDLGPQHSSTHKTHHGGGGQPSQSQMMSICQELLMGGRPNTHGIPSSQLASMCQMLMGGGGQDTGGGMMPIMGGGPGGMGPGGPGGMMPGGGGGPDDSGYGGLGGDYGGSGGGMGSEDW